VAVEQCAPVWAKRYALRIDLDLDRIELSNEACGALFGVVQEAVANAGRHADAGVVRVSLHQTDGGAVELVVRDDGHGFDPDAPPFATDDPGHIGLVTMRERTEVAGGTLTIDTGGDGTAVIARVPAAAARPSPASG
jgi:signal transduction histidine kinase